MKRLLLIALLCVCGAVAVQAEYPKTEKPEYPEYPKAEKPEYPEYPKAEKPEYPEYPGVKKADHKGPAPVAKAQDARNKPHAGKAKPSKAPAKKHKRKGIEERKLQEVVSAAEQPYAGEASKPQVEPEYPEKPEYPAEQKPEYPKEEKPQYPQDEYPQPPAF